MITALPTAHTHSNPIYVHISIFIAITFFSCRISINFVSVYTSHVKAINNKHFSGKILCKKKIRNFPSHELNITPKKLSFLDYICTTSKVLRIVYLTIFFISFFSRSIRLYQFLYIFSSNFPFDLMVYSNEHQK